MKREDFYIGQKLQLPIRHEEEWAICDPFVSVTDISEDLNIVHYSLKLNDVMDGVLNSGMFFVEANEYVEQTTKK